MMIYSETWKQIRMPAVLSIFKGGTNYSNKRLQQALIVDTLAEVLNRQQIKFQKGGRGGRNEGGTSMETVQIKLSQCAA